MTSLEFFCGSGNLSNELELTGYTAQTLDIVQLKNSRKVDFLINFLDFDYQAYNPGHFEVLFFGLPCTAFSKASGGKHFDKEFNPLTETAINSVLMLKRTIEIINYFSSATWYIENPAGRLACHPITHDFIKKTRALVWRFDMIIFGFPTKKQTDLITNSVIPFLYCPVHRVNGKYQKNKFDNLTLKKRQAYTSDFCKFVVNNIIHIQPARGKKPPAERQYNQ